MRDEEEVGKGVLESVVRSEIEALLAEAERHFLDVIQIVALEGAELVGHAPGTSENNAFGVRWLASAFKAAASRRTPKA
jgi:hypothetical protein